MNEEQFYCFCDFGLGVHFHMLSPLYVIRFTDHTCNFFAILLHGYVGIFMIDIYFQRCTKWFNTDALVSLGILIIDASEDQLNYVINEDDGADSCILPIATFVTITKQYHWC